MKNSDNKYKIPGSLWRSNHYFVVITDKDGNILAHNEVFKSSAQFNASNIFSNLVESDKVLLGVSLNKLKPQVTRSLTLRSIINKKLVLSSWDFSLDSQNCYTFIGHDTTKAFNTKIELEKSLSKLSAQKELFRVLLEKNKAGFWYWDLEKDKQKLSPEIKSMLQIEGNKGSELTWQSRISNKELKLIKANLKDHFLSQGVVPFYQEIKNTLPDGSPLWVICFGKVFRWNNGKPQRMVGCFIDITKTKTSEEIIMRQNESLRKISFNQSHHMRAKLANIMGLLNILDEKKLNQDNKAFYKLLKKETEKLDKIIRENVSDTNHSTPTSLGTLIRQN